MGDYLVGAVELEVAELTAKLGGAVAWHDAVMLVDTMSQPKQPSFLRDGYLLKSESQEEKLDTLIQNGLNFSYLKGKRY